MNWDKSTTETLTDFLRIIYTSLEIHKSKSIGTLDEKWTQKLKLTTPYQHGLVDACIFLLEDTECAIEDVVALGLQGPTRSKSNFGERYLRLYGFLNAIYLQKSVAIQLIEMFDLTGKNKATKKFQDSRLLQFRNHAGAHTVDNFKKDFFMLFQHTIVDNGESIKYFRNDKSETINILEELALFRKIFYEIMFDNLTQIVNKVYPSYKIYDTLINDLKIIKYKIEGNIIVSVEGKDPIIISITPKDPYPMPGFENNENNSN